MIFHFTVTLHTLICLQLTNIGVTLAQLVKASVGQADVQRFEPTLGHNRVRCGVYFVRSRHFGLPLARTTRIKLAVSKQMALSLYKRGVFRSGGRPLRGGGLVARERARTAAAGCARDTKLALRSYEDTCLLCLRSLQVAPEGVPT